MRKLNVFTAEAKGEPLVLRWVIGETGDIQDEFVECVTSAMDMGVEILQVYEGDLLLYHTDFTQRG